MASAQAQGILNLSQQGFGPKPGITNMGREGGKEGGRGRPPRLGIHGSNGCFPSKSKSEKGPESPDRTGDPRGSQNSPGHLVALASALTSGPTPPRARIPVGSGRISKGVISG